MALLWKILFAVSAVASRTGSSVCSFTPTPSGRYYSVGTVLRERVSADGGVGSSKISFDCLENKKILVVGGSGRVGGSVVTQLIKRGASRVTVGGTNLNRFEESRARWMELFSKQQENFQHNVDFVAIDRENQESISSALKAGSYDLVVNTAGPFQGKVTAKNGVLEAAIMNKISYVDVCDDYCTASAAKTKYAKQARDNGVPCLISTGCWPGVSSLMAKQLVTKVLKSKPELSANDLTVDFSFFTAGKTMKLLCDLLPEIN